MKSLTILADVDDVTCDLVPAWLARYNRDYGDTLVPDDIKNWTMTDWVSEACGDKIYDYLKDPTLYDEVRPVSGAIHGVDALRRAGHRVVFVTSASGEGMGAKLAWLIRYDFLPKHTYIHPDYVVAHDKNLIRGDMLIDDRYSNVVGFSGIKALFRRPWNDSESSGYDVRVYSWADVGRFVEQYAILREAVAA